ncbi:sensor ATPase, GAF domain-containing [Citrifermentans bemidjiense Bem]|uniref:histidine kinase n=1 Tax=Citrifermentans bemidjiense (strain ATCC BAA-1014 / DSM 16622 / JCM 12645 / Bem) TaxID=404380 RepID=B5EDD5_CITBB|nr:ATP-binding protein [Citrifermentans bemidjiense]ACH39131.1 sensor ATPase, GAF domain-containing [Citrifermentans bemidjiense Bem]
MQPSRLRDMPLYNSRIINSYILLIKHKYSHVDISELLLYAGMKEYEVADQAHWFSQEQIDRFHEKLQQMTGNARISREAGRYAASPDVLGAMRQYILGLVDASSTFDIISKTTAKFTRSSSYQSRSIASNQVEITVTPYEPGLEKPYQCENRIGFFEAIVLVFNHKMTDLQYFPEIRNLPTIEHPECMFRGDPVCRYIVTWEKTLFTFLKKMRNLLALPLAALNLALLAMGDTGVLTWVFPSSLCVLLLVALATESSEKKAIKESLWSTRDSIENLLDQINLNYNNAMLTHEIGQRLGNYTRIEEMLFDVAQIMRYRLEYDRGMIFLADGGRKRLELRASYGYKDEELACLNSLPFLLENRELGDVYLECFRGQRPFLVNELSSGSVGENTLACAHMSGTRAFICCPIVADGASLGVLTVENVQVKRPLVERDISLIMGTASVLGISIRNCELIGALETANEELELRVAKRTQDLEKSRQKMQEQHEELVRTYFDLEEETAQRLNALEELARKERMLLQQNRLAALGEMINNIAHQWRQPLNELGLIVQELPIMYDRGDFNKEYLRESVAKFMKVLSHTSKTIDDFRTFFKPDREMVPFRVTEVVDKALSLVAESLKHLEIKVTVHSVDDPAIMGHPNEFSQAILNILFNARDAFKERSISCRQIEIRIFLEDETAVVTIGDNAGGIPEEIMDKIFDPYFTTRGPEQGTGIGLYMTKMIIEKNIPGKLSVRNTEKGAEFRIEVGKVASRQH